MGREVNVGVKVGMQRRGEMRGGRKNEGGGGEEAFLDHEPQSLSSSS